MPPVEVLRAVPQPHRPHPNGRLLETILGDPDRLDDRLCDPLLVLRNRPRPDRSRLRLPPQPPHVRPRMIVRGHDDDPRRIPPHLRQPLPGLNRPIDPEPHEIHGHQGQPLAPTLQHQRPHLDRVVHFQRRPQIPEPPDEHGIELAVPIRIIEGLVTPLLRSIRHIPTPIEPKVPVEVGKRLGHDGCDVDDSDPHPIRGWDLHDVLRKGGVGVVGVVGARTANRVGTAQEEREDQPPFHGGTLPRRAGDRGQSVLQVCQP